MLKLIDFSAASNTYQNLLSAYIMIELCLWKCLTICLKDLDYLETLRDW